MFGFLNVYKPKGITSHDVVARLRKVTKIKQIGHTGTLDPFAEGVLPVCIGKATRLIEYLRDDKAYIATIQFGKTTDTYDIDGKVLTTSDKIISEQDVINGLKSFEGEIEQTPPIYSALKVDGKKLYEYAREGVEVEIKSRKTFIEKIELLSFNKEEQSAKIFVKCSKGTYIRSIGYDLGQNLGCGAYLSALVRAQAGDFNLDLATNLDDFKTIENVQKNIISPLNKLPLKQVEINNIELKRICNGLQIYPREKINGLVTLVNNSKIVAIATATEVEIKAKKVVYEN